MSTTLFLTANALCFLFRLFPSSSLCLLLFQKPDCLKTFALWLCSLNNVFSLPVYSSPSNNVIVLEQMHSSEQLRNTGDPGGPAAARRNFSQSSSMALSTSKRLGPGAAGSGSKHTFLRRK
jgi:hypothetical protein